MKNKIFFLTIQVLILLSFCSRSQVVINEFSCSNLDQYLDNFGKYEDWIELYNAGSTSVSLEGFSLSDDSASAVKWEIPAGISIAGNGFLRFWADDRDTVIGTNYHTSFKLTQTKNSNEFITLCNPSGIIIDQKEIKQRTQLGHSIGRTTNGAATWSVFISPTPNATNNTSTPYTDYASKPDASSTAGFYTSPFTVVLSTNEVNADIHYTLDGSQPSASSALYTFPINITNTTVLKAITISADPTILPSFIIYDTYFMNVNHTTVVVSISGEEVDDLANGNDALTPIGTFEYFDLNKQRTAKTMGEFNKHGQDSWVLSQRSIDFISRDEMGYNSALKEKIFNYSTRDSYQRILLRAAGDDNYPADHNPSNAGSAHIRDAYVMTLSKSGGLDLDVRMSEKAIVYLNGQYWGVYDLREKPDDADYTDFYYGQDKYHIQYLLYWGGRWAHYGGQQAMDDWDNFYNYAMTHNMTDPVQYKYVTDRLDEKSLTDYVLVNMFTVCSDWLNWNVGWWRGLDSAGSHLKWGFILWDNDAVFGHYINYTGIPNTNPNADPCDPETLSGTSSDPEGMMALLMHLRQNPDFNNYYITRQLDLWNTVFKCDHMIPYLDSVVAIIDPEMNQHAIRWGGTYSEWQTNVQQLRTYILQRCDSLTNGFMDCYNLTGPYNLTLNADPLAGGKIKLNTMTIDQLPWSGTYFGGIENKLVVSPSTGYVFDQWASVNNVILPFATEDSIRITLNSSDTVTAHFIYTDIADLDKAKASVTAYPTVFSQETTLMFNLPEEMPVYIKIISLNGSELITVLNGERNIQPGVYEMKLNFSGLGLPAGMYLVDFIAGNSRENVKLIYSPE
jgi:hypothetical protein